MLPQYVGSIARGQASVLFMGWRSRQVTMEDLSSPPPLDMEKLITTNLKRHIGCENQGVLDDMKTKGTGADSWALQCLSCLALSHESVPSVPVE